MPVFLDIETLPSEVFDMEAAKKRITPPANYKDADKIAAYIDEQAAKAHAKTSLNGGYGRIACIGVADEEKTVQILTGTEQEILAKFYDFMMKDNTLHAQLCGHNIIAFDLPFIWRRAVVNGCPLYTGFPLHVRWNGTQVFDTMIEWEQNHGFISQSELCSILGIECADEIDGSQVAEAWARGEQQKVYDHCRADVERVREIYKRMTAV